MKSKLTVEVIYTFGALKKGEQFNVLESYSGRYLIRIQGWKASYLKSDFEPLS